MINELIDIAERAGELVLTIYNKGPVQAIEKQDHSLLTEADTASHAFICDAIHKRFPDIPVVSEESNIQYAYEQRKNWEFFFLVDPLDGTKEFVKRNGEFTINIALISHNLPVQGIIHAPALHVTYHAEKGKGAYKIIDGKTIRLPLATHSFESLRAILSRSHGCTKNDDFLKNLQEAGRKVEVMNMGSALKFGLLAEGKADIYPRFSPTMEWDTAAGQILVNETGKKVISKSDNRELTYNKMSLVNPEFVVE